MRHALLSIALAALAASGCVQEVSPATGCGGDADCAGGEVCVDAVCRFASDPLVRACSVAEEGAHCGVGSYCASGICADLPSCAGGAACPSGLVCNEGTGSCIRAPDCEDCCTAASCDDGRWCNGVEVCDGASGACGAGEPPCGSGVCDEATRSCLCGDDSDCVPPATCDDGACGCTPDCAGRQCGADGCGGVCGECADEDECTDGLCSCVPDCAGKQCGSDGCDGACGTCAGGDTCVDGTCQCIPSCDGRVCGDDGCGGSCGTCDVGACGSDGQCGCVPSCAGRVCGDDGCGGSCGTCNVGVCGGDGQCNCTPDCSGRECGSDGCGGSCGTCNAYQTCSAAGECRNTGVVCDAFTDTITQREYQSRTGALSPGFDEQYRWHDRADRYIDNYPLVNLPDRAFTMTIEMTSTAFDPMVYLYGIKNDGSCWRLAFDDNSGGNQNAALSVALPARGAREYREYHIVTSTSGTPPLASGSYRVSTTADLCGSPAQNQTVYDRCRDRALATNCASNVCLDFGNSPEFCCITDSCHSGYATGGEVRIFSSVPVCMP